MDGITDFLADMPWYAWVAIIAIAGSTVAQIVRMSYQHEERMALIKQGRDPDSGGDEG